jgi:tRNA A-37 threonylcarbamoyl transferase component Bud32
VALADIHSAYLRARGWGPGAPGFGLAELQRAVGRARARRVRQYLRKTTRACSEYHVERAGGFARICVRALRGAGLQQFFRDPEALFGTGTMVKDGNSATVVRLVMGGRSWIVKRYNVKNAWHGLRRALKPNARQRNAWRNGQRLHFLGIPTARPVALLERRVGPFSGTAYLVMEDLGARDLLGEGRAGRIDATLLNRVVELFALLRALGITHGDTKATNFIVQAPGSAGKHERSVALIDLDSMHASARGCARDRARFLENWRGEPELAQRFRDAFRAAGLDVGPD